MSMILSKVKNDLIAFTQASAQEEDWSSETEFSETLPEYNDKIKLTSAPLNEKEALDYVRDAGAGAMVLFEGTTRNEFQGKSVQRLEYTAYSSLARKMMKACVESARVNETIETESCVNKTTDHGRHSDNPPPDDSLQSPKLRNSVKRIYLAHRIGSVDVKEPSILVCVSSAHRREAFETCSKILEKVKHDVPIWKKEIYDGQHAGEEEWKANVS